LFDKKFKHGSQFRKQLIDYAYSKEFMMFGDYKLKFYKEMTRHEYLIVYVYNSMSDIMLFETKHFQEMTLKKFHDETGVRLFPEKSGNCKIIFQDGFERKMKIKNLKLKIILIVFVFLYSIPYSLFPAYAQVDIGENFGFGDIKSLGEGTTRLVNPLFSIAALLVILYFLFGAFKYLRAGGNKEEVEQGRQQIEHAIIGFILLMLSFLMLQYILSSLFGASLEIIR